MNYLRFADLKQRNIVRNWTTLLRLIEEQGFPAGIRIGAQARGWGEAEVEEWLKSRRIASVAAPDGAVRALLEVEPLAGPIWEPACGPGAIVRVLRAAGHHVVASDLADHGCPQSLAGVDFLKQEHAPESVQTILTNPPDKLADKFVRHALELAPRVAMLLRLTFLERADILDRGRLARVYPFRNQLPLMHQDGPQATSATALAWFVWNETHKGPTCLSRIPWQEGGIMSTTNSLADRKPEPAQEPAPAAAKSNADRRQHEARPRAPRPIARSHKPPATPRDRPPVRATAQPRMRFPSIE
jgi:hypothetical protein